VRLLAAYALFLPKAGHFSALSQMFQVLLRQIFHFLSVLVPFQPRSPVHLRYFVLIAAE